MIGPLGPPGALGPQGPTGPPGPQGLPGSGPRILDGSGQLLGPLMTPANSPVVGTVLFFDASGWRTDGFGGLPIAVGLDVNGGVHSFPISGAPAFTQFELYFPSADCSGQSYTATIPGFAASACFVLNGILYYFPPDQGTSLNVAAYQSVHSDGTVDPCVTQTFRIPAVPFTFNPVRPFPGPIRISR